MRNGGTGSVQSWLACANVLPARARARTDTREAIFLFWRMLVLGKNRRKLGSGDKHKPNRRRAPNNTVVGKCPEQFHKPQGKASSSPVTKRGSL